MGDIDGRGSILRCHVCGDIAEREIGIPLFDGAGSTRKARVRCACRCRMKEKEEVEERLRFEEEQRTADSLRRLSLMDARLVAARFSDYRVTDANRKAFGIANKYAENFTGMYASGQGLLFWGNAGTGKSYTAAAIANELLDRMQPVIMTSFVKLIGELSGFGDDGGGHMAKLNQAKLLVIDDLGAERGTDFSLEKVYSIIDSRYRSGKPIILTTNLELTYMKSCDDIRYSRIYDRIFEMCYPVNMGGLSWRKKDAVKRFDELQGLFGG